MSRAGETSRVYVVADDVNEAIDDLTIEWSADRRQCWIVDFDELVFDARMRRPRLARRGKRSPPRGAPR